MARRPQGPGRRGIPGAAALYPRARPAGGRGGSAGSGSGPHHLISAHRCTGVHGSALHGTARWVAVRPVARPPLCMALGLRVMRPVGSVGAAPEARHGAAQLCSLRRERVALAIRRQFGGVGRIASAAVGWAPGIPPAGSDHCPLHNPREGTGRDVPSQPRGWAHLSAAAALRAQPEAPLRR